MTYAQQSDLLAGHIGTHEISNVQVSLTFCSGLLKMYCTRVAHDVADVSVLFILRSYSDPHCNPGFCSGMILRRLVQLDLKLLCRSSAGELSQRSAACIYA